jgi:hypothetical protein
VPGILMLVTSYWLLPRLGINAVGIAALASETLVALVLIVLERHTILRVFSPAIVKNG